MKYLKLDARHPECHGLARALAGSHGECNGDDQKLLVVYEDYFLIEHQTPFGDFWKVKEICLTLDTLKLCPYVAMREDVSVLVQPWAMGHTGLINTIHSGESLEIVVGDYGAFGLGELTLDLNNLPKGAEVVEL